jgi:hypothetical protein
LFICSLEESKLKKFEFNLRIKSNDWKKLQQHISGKA